MSSNKRMSEGFVFGHYFLERRLAHGGMAEVYLGKDMDLFGDAPPCVVKCILPDLAGDPQFLAMFLNEAQLAAQMNHPNLVKVLDFGEQDGLLYMAMEFVKGLDCWRFNRRAYPFGENHTAIAIYIMQELLDGLHHAHAMTDVNGEPLNVVHRDLSPSNIYLSTEGHVKLGDFGIAQIESDRFRAIDYVPRGKFGYVSPEQIEGHRIDRRADIFSAGIILAELLIGKKLFKGPSQLSVILEIRDGRFNTLEAYKDRVEPGLLEILYKALAKNPEDRFPTAAELADHLTGYLGMRGATSEDLAEQVMLALAYDKGRSGPTVSRAPRDKGNAHQRATVPPTPSGVPTNPSAVDELDREQEEAVRETQGVSWDPEIKEIDLDSDVPLVTDFDPAEKEWLYTVRHSDGQSLGPMSYAAIMELVCRDEILSDTEVSLNNGPFKPAELYPELARHIPVMTPTRDVDDVVQPDRRGDLTVEAPAEVILSLALADETGLLVCKHDGNRKEVYLKSGKPYYVNSNTPSELLGEYLVSKGVISRQQLDDALDVLPKYDGHVGDTLIALGVLSAVDLFHAIGNQIKDRLRDLLLWRQGTYEFYRERGAKKNAMEFPIDAFRFVVEFLVQRSGELSGREIVERLREGFIDTTPAAPDLLKYLTFPPNIDDLIRDTLEPIQVGDLADTMSSDNETRALATALYVALESGIWMLEGTPLPWR